MAERLVTRENKLNFPVKFVVKSKGAWPSSSPNTFSLVRDNWDDFGFRTLFVLHYADRNGETQELGAVKIGEFGLGDDDGRPNLSGSFRDLESTQFSVGQDREYYEALLALDGGLGQRVLAALNDIALDEELFERAINETVATTSLFRTVDQRTVEEQFRRIARGGVALTRYHFKYRYPETGSNDPPTLDFEVRPSSMPPTNVHVLIGSNGAGKTSLLRNMTNALLDPSPRYGFFTDSVPNSDEIPFVNLVTVTFSAFDPFEPVDDSETSDLRHSYIGLKAGKDRETVKTTEHLAKDFLDSLNACSKGPRRSRWRDAIGTLNSDPLLADSDIIDLLGPDNMEPDSDLVVSRFSALSSGHKIVMLTITRLIETVEEKSLVLMDEPEAHLHPPLLSAFTRALSDLLEERNGVAIIATHSPVVLQEVPQDCVYKISRLGSIVKADRLDIESFGEGVGTLTSTVFGLEVTDTGFHQLLLKALTRAAGSYDGALDHFDGQLGGEARAILRSLSTSVSS